MEQAQDNSLPSVIKGVIEQGSIEAMAPGEYSWVWAGALIVSPDSKVFLRRSVCERSSEAASTSGPFYVKVVRDFDGYIVDASGVPDGSLYNCFKATESDSLQALRDMEDLITPKLVLYPVEIMFEGINLTDLSQYQQEQRDARSAFASYYEITYSMPYRYGEVEMAEARIGPSTSDPSEGPSESELAIGTQTGSSVRFSVIPHKNAHCFAVRVSPSTVEPVLGLLGKQLSLPFISDQGESCIVPTSDLVSVVAGLSGLLRANSDVKTIEVLVEPECESLALNNLEELAAAAASSADGLNNGLSRLRVGLKWYRCQPDSESAILGFEEMEAFNEFIEAIRTLSTGGNLTEQLEQIGPVDDVSKAVGGELYLLLSKRKQIADLPRLALGRPAVNLRSAVEEILKPDGSDERLLAAVGKRPLTRTSTRLTKLQELSDQLKMAHAAEIYRKYQNSQKPDSFKAFNAIALQTIRTSQRGPAQC